MIIAFFTVSFFSFALQCNPTFMQGNFGLKLQNSAKLPRILLDFIVIQMSRVNREKGLL